MTGVNGALMFRERQQVTRTRMVEKAMPILAITACSGVGNISFLVPI